MSSILDEKRLSEWRQYQQEISAKAQFYNLDLSFRVVDERPLDFERSEIDHPVVRNAGNESDPADFSGLNYIGGLDISFRSLTSNDAVASLAILSFPQLELLDVISENVTLEVPYVPGYLSMREAKPLVSLIKRYRSSEHAHRSPQVFFVDGNGRLHERQAGSATMIGVLANVPCLGIAKEYHSPIPVQNLEDKAPLHFRASQKAFREVTTDKLVKRGDWLALPDESGNENLGAALRTSSSQTSTRPIFVSSGHRLSLATCLRLALLTTKTGRLPEPIRFADHYSRAETKRLWSEG